jgi:GT2 family glycosyltransferase
MNNNLISIILINWNGYKFTKDCIESVLSSNYNNFEITLVDNNSDNNEGQKLKNIFSEKINLIQSYKNLGFAGGNNLGVDNSKGDIIFFLNNDTIIQPNTLEILINDLENKEVGIVMPKILFYGTDKIQTTGNYSNIFSKTKLFLRNKKSDSFTRIRECEFASGAALMISRELYEKIGGFHNFLFIYGDDNSLSYRSWIGGHKVICDGRTFIYHNESSSIKKKTLPWFSYHQIRALISIQIINFELKTLFYRQFFYSLFQTISFLKRIIIFQLKLGFAIPRAYFWVIINIKTILKNRRITQAFRINNDNRYLKIN